MRAKEFVVETKRGKPLDAQKSVSPGAVYTIDGLFDLYRASQLMARAPVGSDDIDPYSFVTKLPLIVTYTDEEKQMVRDAFKRMNIEFKEHIPGDSEEPDAVNNVSPVTGFKGY